MNATPRLEINLKHFRQNVKVVLSLCRKSGIEPAGVTKSFLARPEMANIYCQEGIAYLADARIENLAAMADIPCEKMMLRLPMMSEASDVVRYSALSLNSELETIIALNKAAEAQGKNHGIILMVDLGDRREGYVNEYKLFSDVEYIIKNLPHVTIMGVGLNLTCYAGVLPDNFIMRRLVTIADYLRETYKLDLPIVSGGNSSSIHLMLEGDTLKGVNQLRLGEAFLFGTEASYGKAIPNTNHDVFRLKAEVVEIKTKPTQPQGKRGTNAFGEVPEFEDLGNHRMAICAIGQQDVDYSDLCPINKNIKIRGASSDHLILDVDDLEKDLKIGDEVTFDVNYGGLLRLMTSPFVEKVFLPEE